MAKGALGQDSLVGRALGHYRIVEKIGEGGMGVVYRARDEHLDRDVAIKILPPGSLTDEIARQRFRKEALALPKLNHSNIAVVIDFDECDGIDYLAQEFVAGLALDEMLESGGLRRNASNSVCSSALGWRRPMSMALFTATSSLVTFASPQTDSSRSSILV